MSPSMNPKTEPIRLMIADNHHLLRKGIGLCLQLTGDIRIVGEASNGIEAVEQSWILKPDMLLMDVLLPHMDGITATRLIHHQNERIKTLIFTILDDKALIKAALKAGA